MHSDQGSQLGSDDFTNWWQNNQLIRSMSRRGNGYDNAVVESSFQQFEEGTHQTRIYASRQEAKSEAFDYIEEFYNRTRRHSHLGQLSPMAFEKLQTGSC